jgi:hypothetical protein
VASSCCRFFSCCQQNWISFAVGADSGSKKTFLLAFHEGKLSKENSSMKMWWAPKIHKAFQLKPVMLPFSMENFLLPSTTDRRFQIFRENESFSIIHREKGGNFPASFFSHSHFERNLPETWGFGEGEEGGVNDDEVFEDAFNCIIFLRNIFIKTENGFRFLFRPLHKICCLI